MENIDFKAADFRPEDGETQDIEKAFKEFSEQDILPASIEGEGVGDIREAILTACEKNGKLKNSVTALYGIRTSTGTGELAKTISTIKSSSEELVEARRDFFTVMSDMIDAEIPEVLPSIGILSTGEYLFYDGMVNEVHGPPANGKTMCLLAVSISALEEGYTVIFIDPESNSRSIARRLQFLLKDRKLAKNFLYRQPPRSECEWIELLTHVSSNEKCVLILDSLINFLSLEGISENSNDEVVDWLMRHAKSAADAGACVIVSDHVVKSKEGDKAWARGASSKNGFYKGAIYEMKQGKPFSKTKDGYSRLILVKDNESGVGTQGDEIARLVCENGVFELRALNEEEQAEERRKSASGKSTPAAERMDWLRDKLKRNAYIKADLINEASDHFEVSYSTIDRHIKALIQTADKSIGEVEKATVGPRNFCHLIGRPSDRERALADFRKRKELNNTRAVSLCDLVEDTTPYFDETPPQINIEETTGEENF